jgi:FtsP/CotA-like multicopper oxidase with cupredoxin domain
MKISQRMRNGAPPKNGAQFLHRLHSFAAQRRFHAAMLPRVFLLLLVFSASLRACPWCARYGIKETVSAGQADPGGTFFGQPPPPEQTRHYYLAAEPVLWTWSPLGVNPAKPLPLPPYLEDAPTAAKVRYVQYTDATFTKRAFDTPRLGILGPVLRGVTGEYLAVTFRNHGPTPLSIHPHGVRYDKDSEGAYAAPGSGKGSAVGPGATFTYVWHLDELSGPQPGEPSSKAWLYHSHCKDDEEINLGLLGFIVVTDPKRARPDGTPADVDREMPAMFVIFDETPEDPWEEYLGTEVGETLEPRSPLETFALSELGARHSINGRMFGNLAGLEMRAGERVRWYLGALGEENGIHTAHWHGARLREEGRRVVDVVSLLPGETKVADQLADNPGSWLLHCHVSDHMMEGMFASYVVHPRDAPAPPDPFLGDLAPPSLRWTGADIALDFAADAETPAEAELHGVVTIHPGFYPRRSALAVRLGARRVPLVFTDKTSASGEGARFAALDTNEQGVVEDNTLHFKLSLDGVEWRTALAAAGLRRGAGGRVELPIEIEINGARHAGPLAIEAVAQGERIEAHQP